MFEIKEPRPTNWPEAAICIACVLSIVLIPFAAGCSVVVKKGDQASVDNWIAAENRTLDDWAGLMGITRTEARLLEAKDFPIQIKGTRPNGSEFEYELDWITWETTRDGFTVFREYEEDKVEEEKPKEEEQDE